MKKANIKKVSVPIRIVLKTEKNDLIHSDKNIIAEYYAKCFLQRLEPQLYYRTKNCYYNTPTFFFISSELINVVMFFYFFSTKNIK